MYIVPLAWLYVALMMAVAEATNDHGTVLGGLITFVLYGLGPVLLVLYLIGSPARRRAIKAKDAKDAEDAKEAALAASPVAEPVPPRAIPSAMPLQPEALRPPSAQPASTQPDAGSHAPAAAHSAGVAPVRKEP